MSASKTAQTRPKARAPQRLLLCALLPVLLAGCDLLGIESTEAVSARKEADGKAVGAGCRHAARSVEQCYGLNKRADKAAVFAGWKEMNDYMRENKIDAVPPPPPAASAPEGEEAAGEAADDGAGKAKGGKGGGKKH